MISKLTTFSSTLVKYYVNSYTNTVFPVLCLGFQLPILVHQKKYDHLPFLVLFPVGYSAYFVGVSAVENLKNNCKTE